MKNLYTRSYGILLPLSGFTITLNKSRDYVRCAVLIHVLAVIVLIRSALPLLMIFMLFLVLIIFFIFIIYSKSPISTYHKLSYHPGYWLLHEVNGNHIKFEHASIGFEGGVFLLLTLTGISPRKNLVIFKDQISTEEYRILKLSSIRK